VAPPRPSFRVLVTGGNGFVGPYLVRALAAMLPAGHEIIVGYHGNAPVFAEGHIRCVPFDITSAEQVRAVLAAEEPTHLFHLAAIAAIDAARADIRQTWSVNFDGTLNIAIGVTEAVPDCRVLYCSSGQVYGAGEGQPLDEGAPYNPHDAYGASKAAADLMIGQMARQGLRAIRLRPFNHTGAGQNEHFVAPAFAAQVARIERGEQEPVISVGNLTGRRDFLDVRDVADAYARAVLRFDTLPSGCALNIASGRAIAMSEILDMLLSMSSCRIEVRQDPKRMRGNDMSVVVGDATLARRLLDWEPRMPLRETLSGLLAHYRIGKS
jgi:GDP-4-dehydro-6-deoxy-D-mannose reductase